MGCTNPDIEKYLHYDHGKKVFSSNRFRKWHLLYRTGFRDDKKNPLIIPSVLTSFSLNWSKLIKPQHVLKTVLAENPKLGDCVYYGQVKNINKINLDENCDSGMYEGKHNITSELDHSPNPCNYSHCEILIRHSYFENGERREELLKYDDWKDCKLNVGKPPAFFKKLRNDYRAKIGTILNNNLDEKPSWFYSLINSRKILSLILLIQLNIHNLNLKKK